MYQKTVLENQLRVVTHSMKGRDSIGVGIWVGSGGRYEEDRIKGAAHFLEHIVFKGTRKYSCGKIKELIEGVGGSLNAFTSEEQTCYFAKIPSKHLPKTFDILADMVFNPLITKKDVAKESGVILEEIKMYHDLPQYYVLELLDGLMWPDHPLGKNLAGTFESIKDMSHEDLREFHRTFYYPGNVVVSACGQLEHRQFVSLINKKLAKYSRQDEVNFIAADNSQDRPEVKFLRKDIEQMHLALGMLGLHQDHKDKYAWGLLNIILGGNMSSRLFDEVREKRGLAYSISSSAKAFKDTGLFLIRAGVDNKKIVEALEVILKELRKIRREGVTEGEFKRAKEYFLGQTLLGLEDTLDHMLWIGESTIALDRIRTLKEVISLVNKVHKAEIKRVAGQILIDNRMNLALVGPITEAQEKQLSILMGIKA